LLEWLSTRHKQPGLARAALRIDRGIEKTITQARHLTPDIGGSSSTHEMGTAIAEAAGNARADEVEGRG
jgi:3-isopropylmalate dehydrogenase